MKTRRITPIWAMNALVLLAASTVSEVSFAKDDARIATLRAAELERFAANVDADARALDRLLDAELEYVHSNGVVDTKNAFIESLTSGRRDYLSSTPTIETIRIIGDVAIIRGRVLVKVSDVGTVRDLDIGYTDVWVWKDQRWQMTAWRSARMPPPATAPAAPAK